MELLAPVGNLENFQAAIEAGADAVYVGVPGFNARNLSRDLTLEEIGAMIRHCHDLGKKLYIAANSLILEKEIPLVVETLARLEFLEPDALIVQDLGLIRLVRKNFPQLVLHASTLLTAHNSDAVRFLSDIGCRRVVLARELTVNEIEFIARRTTAELEVFVHGAMCFSYSGLCLFSSFLGGKSGLRGRCVQPCRRFYKWQERSAKSRQKAQGGGYLFSMNDLEGLEIVPELRRIGIASLKIEGRLRSAHYVSHVIRAYRTVLDADQDSWDNALHQAKELISDAMGRTVSTGFFLSPQPKKAISPHYSGNTGHHLGQIRKFVSREGRIFGVVTLKSSLEDGERLRLHLESSGDRQPFTLKLLKIDENPVTRAETGMTVSILLPDSIDGIPKGKVDLYKTGIRQERGDVDRFTLDVKAIQKELETNKTSLDRLSRTLIARIIEPEQQKTYPKRAVGASIARERFSRKAGVQDFPLEWWLKTDSLNTVLAKLPFSPNRLVIAIDKNLTAQAGAIKKHLGQQARKIIWSLPPILSGGESGRMMKMLKMLMRSGFKSFQIGHLSQAILFHGEKVHLYGDFTLNLMNHQAIAQAEQAGLEAAQLSLEMDRGSIGFLLGRCSRREGNGSAVRRTEISGIRVGLTVYGAPALFTSRLAAEHFQYNRAFVSPKGESFLIRKKEGGTQTFPTRPFSLLPAMQELADMGLHYAVVDITGLDYDKKGLEELADRISGKGRFGKLPTFNYYGKLD